VVTVAVATAPLFAQALIASGAELQVNVYTTSGQRRPSIAVDDQGAFVVSWSGFGTQDGYYSGVFGRRFDSTGAPRGVEFQINAYTPRSQERSHLATQSDGDFIVAWQSDRDGGTYGIFAQRYDSAGLGLSTEFQVNSATLVPTQHPHRARSARTGPRDAS
jgi:hypothetical protein